MRSYRLPRDIKEKQLICRRQLETRALLQPFFELQVQVAA